MPAKFHPTAVRSSFARRFTSTLLTLSMGVAGFGAAMPAHAEGQIRIAEQFGIVYLLLNVARDQQFVEKEGRKQGLDIKVDWVKLSGGAAVNDALLSGKSRIALNSGDAVWTSPVQFFQAAATMESQTSRFVDIEDYDTTAN